MSFFALLIRNPVETEETWVSDGKYQYAVIPKKSRKKAKKGFKKMKKKFISECKKKESKVKDCVKIDDCKKFGECMEKIK